MAHAYQDGYEWHREQLAAMPGLREYVCRPDFLGANALLPTDGESMTQMSKPTGKEDT